MAVSADSSLQRPAVGHSIPRVPLRAAGLLLVLIVVALTIDATIRERGDFDYWFLNTVRRLQFPGVETVMRAASTITSTNVAVSLWLLLLAAFFVSRRWLDVAAMFAIPTVGIVNWVIRAIIGRTRPDPTRLDPPVSDSELYRMLHSNDFQSFPSGHVAGGILLWGFIFFLAGDLHSRVLRVTVRTFAVGVIVLVGPSRMWLGAHWASDVVTGYSLGGLWLLCILAAYRVMAPTMRGIPLIHAAPVQHPEASAHAHALTSTLLFGDGKVWKIYNPGFVPRFIYWMAFQAPFGYAHNRLALEAAVLRRNLAAKLTDAWFGSPRVSPALGVGEVAGRLALIGHYTDGVEPRDHDRARAYLFDLAERFDRAGLPTWQIDPRQPRSFGNILETEAGEYVVIDLESGLVSPMASPRAWFRAIRRGLVPMYDDVFFDLTRAHIAEEETRLRRERGDAFYEELATLAIEAEAATAAWHASEPRVWSHAVTAIESGFGIKTWPRRLAAWGRSGREHADDWISGAIDGWHDEARLTSTEAENLRASLLSPGTQAVLPHFGVHLVIGMVLRFPFGAISRVAYTTANLLIAVVRFAMRRITWERFRRDLSIHSPLVILIAALPGFGSFSYMASGPIWRNHLLARVVVDAVGQKVPFHLYQRFGFRRLVARPIRSAAPRPGGQVNA